MALRALILPYVIEQDFEATVDTAVIQIETEATDLKRFTAAFVPPRNSAFWARSGSCIRSRSAAFKIFFRAMYNRG